MKEDSENNSSMSDDENRSGDFDNEMGERNGEQDGYEGGQRRKRERRSKEDGSQRNYVCGCGKSYLSYAALYTHAKTKHNGIFPEGTTTLHKKKQGRPKKYDSSVDKNVDGQRRQNFNEDLQAFLQICPNSQRSENDAYPNFVESFPKEFFKDTSLFDKILQELNTLRKELEETEGEDYSNQIDNLITNYYSKEANCNKILS